MTADFRVDTEATRWKLLDAAKERLKSAFSLEEIIEIVRSAARAICSADGVTFVLRKDGRCYYVEEDAIRPLWKGQDFPMESCVSGWCMITGRTAAIPDVFEDPRVPKDAYRKTFVKSMVMTPVKTDSPVAAIGAYWSMPRHFSAGEIALLEALAEPVGQAMGSVGR